MTYTLTITSDSPMAMSFVIPATTEEVEEDEYGIPIKYREKIMAMSKESNKNIARRWDEDLAKLEEKQAI